jgi:divalent metal cation (Fe/Co/Zn/Cd) transporter
VVAFAVLAVALVLDGVSLVRAVWQIRGEAHEAGHGIFHQLMRESEPTVRAVFFEDSAAVLGVLLAAGGLGLDVLVHSHVFDAVASIAIGLLLVGVAYLTGAQNRDLLIGRAADPGLVDGLRAEIVGTPGIRGVLETMTMRLGPDELLLATRVDVEPNTSGDDLELVADEVERRVQASYPQVRHVFVDPTPGAGHSARAKGEPAGDQAG